MERRSGRRPAKWEAKGEEEGGLEVSTVNADTPFPHSCSLVFPTLSAVPSLKISPPLFIAVHSSQTFPNHVLSHPTPPSQDAT